MTSRAKPSRSSRSSRKPKPRAGSPSTGRPVRQAALAEVKDDLSRFLRLAESRRNPDHTTWEAGWGAYRLRERGRLARLSIGAPSRVLAARRRGTRGSPDWPWRPTRGSAVLTGGLTAGWNRPARSRPLSLGVRPQDANDGTLCRPEGEGYGQYRGRAQPHGSRQDVAAADPGPSANVLRLGAGCPTTSYGSSRT